MMKSKTKANIAPPVQEENQESAVTSNEVLTEDDIKNPKCDIEGIKLNLGCGTDLKPGYINIDMYDNYADANWDMRKLPLCNNSVAEIMCYQTLEHIQTKDVLPTLQEWYRVLKPGAKVHLIVPDMISVCEEFIKDSANSWALARVFGSQANEGEFHRTGFTVQSIANLLATAGFVHSKAGIYTHAKYRNIYCVARK